ncbi:MAG: Gfo/Idh/MocA family oxidoreductase [Opitutus sp.]|nr:Gfo/Idh/MocA family oxidoreductase [Opitutus sp.]
MKSSLSINRRQFLQSSALAGSLLILPRGLRGADGRTPNQRINIALVGVGGRGTPALTSLQNENIVALCDVDQKRGRDAVMADPAVKPILEKFAGAKWFKDYRRMFDAMANAIDAVVVCTPDHMHFPVAMTAIALGKHVYVEKPLCRCITEVRTLHAAAKRAGVVTQMGNQGRAGEGIRLVREWVEAGLIGRPHTVHAFTDRPKQPWFNEPEIDPDEGAADEAVPPTLDWDLWRGPSPVRPYRSCLLPEHWRGYVEYGSGSLGDMGIHMMDSLLYGLDLPPPVSIEAITSKLYPKTFPRSTVVTYKFPARGDQPPVEFKWFDGGLLPPRPPEVPVAEWKPSPGGGTIIYGDKGTLWVGSHSGSPRLLPESRMKELRPSLPAKTIPRIVGGPHREWADAIRGGPPCGSQFDYAAPITELVLLGVVAIRAQSRIEWDSAAGKITNIPDANRLLGPGYDYLPGWGV